MTGNRGRLAAIVALYIRSVFMILFIKLVEKIGYMLYNLFIAM